MDPMLELSRDVGDFFFAILQVPLDYILSSPWFLSWCTGKSEGEPGDSSSSIRISSADSGTSARTSNPSSIPVLADHGGAVQPSRVLNKRHESVRSVSDNQHSNDRPSVNNSASLRASRDRHSKSASTTSLPAYSELPSHDPPRYSQTMSRHSGHQIWYPPTSAYPASGQEAPISTPDLPGTPSEYHSPEWRTYPAFPSAYPPTPLPALASLPSSVTTRLASDHRLVSDSAYPPIPEDEQGFDETLEREHEGRPGSVHSSSNSNKIPPGANSCEESSDATRQPDEDTLLDDSMCSSEAGLSEDDFGASLRTPHRSPAAMLPSAYSSVDSLTSALTTAENASFLRTKSSSDSLGSGSSSLAGRKRTHAGFQRNARSTLPTPHSRNATLRGRPAPPPIPQDPPQSSTSEDEDESEVGDDDTTKAKRQRVLDPLKRKSTVRPAAGGLGNARKSVLSSRNATVRSRAITTASQGAARTRPGSAMTINSTIRGRKPTPASRQVMRGGLQGVVKSSSTSSSQSGTLKGRAY
jgi:hypothetical protein